MLTESTSTQLGERTERKKDKRKILVQGGSLQYLKDGDVQAPRFQIRSRPIRNHMVWIQYMYLGGKA